MRRKILAMLSEEKLSFTEMLAELGISSSHLTYHLDCLGELILKEDTKYRLAPIGEAAIKTMSNVKKMQPRSRIGLNNFSKIFQITALILIFILSSRNITLAENLQNRALFLEEKEAEIQVLSNEIFVYRGLSELIYSNQRCPDIKVASYVILSNVENHLSVLNLSLYNPLDNTKLQIDLMHNIHDEAVIIVVEKHSMNDDEGILKKIQLTAKDRHLEVELDSKGWYLLTLRLSTRMKEEQEAYNVLRVWGYCQITYDTKSILFGYLPNTSII
jgi:hypothetical protein